MIEDTELKQVAYIFKCVNSTLQIKGKINSITVGEFFLAKAGSVLELKKAGTLPPLFLEILNRVLSFKVILLTCSLSSPR